MEGRKIVIERIRNELRMGNESLAKAIVLGWYNGLQGRREIIGKQKTVLYRKKMLKKAAVAWTCMKQLML